MTWLQSAKPRRGKSRGSRPIFQADFETTNDPEDNRVWNWFIYNLADDPTPGNVDWGVDIDGFIEHISTFDSIVYFHNLKFDGTFIIDRILRARYEHTKRASLPGQFETLIDRMGKFYSIKIVWRNGFATEFRDSLKKLPFAVKHIARAFKLDMSKGEIDYNKHRPVGYEPTPEEIEYGVKDVLIPAQALQSQFEQGMVKLTAGSDALAEYKNVTGKRVFDKLFPVLASAVDQDIRLAYRGGFTYASPRFKHELQGYGSVYDVNSLYPSVMYDELLPYGEPEWCDGLPEATDGFPLFMVSMTFTAQLKPDHIPIIQVKGASIFSETEYQEQINEPTTLSFTNIDLEMVFKHYDVDVLSYNGGWRFRAGRGMFRKFIDKWSQIKNESEGALREIAKLQLNSLYGKFASNPNITGKYPVLEDNRVKFRLGPEEERDPIYTAMGAWITAYARRVTITAAQLNYDRFAYCDTDSLHLMGTTPPAGIEVHENKLGAWAHEGDFQNAFFIRAKAYVEHMTDGSWSVHIAGVPENIAKRITFDDLWDGNVLDGKLMPRTVPGGIVLEDKTFTLRI